MANPSNPARVLHGAILLAFGLWAGATAAADPSALELRLVHDGELVHLSLPTTKDTKAREQMEMDGWEALAPLSRVLRTQPEADALRTELHAWGKATGRVLTVSAMKMSGDDGKEALHYARIQYRASHQTAEQASVWARVELPPSADVMVVRLALDSYSVDDGIEDVAFKLEWRSAPAPGEDATVRGKYWASDGAAPFRAEVRKGLMAALDLFEAGRHDKLPVAGAALGRVAGFAKPLAVVRDDGERVLLSDGDEGYLSVPRVAWTPLP
jgi:hypothetical protein